MGQLVFFSALVRGQEQLDQKHELADELTALYEDVEGLDPRGRGKQQAIENGTYKKPVNKPTKKPTKKPTNKPTNKPTKPTYTTTEKITTARSTTTSTKTTSATTTSTTTSTTTEKNQQN